jgi:hypothetical protein
VNQEVSMSEEAIRAAREFVRTAALPKPYPALLEARPEAKFDFDVAREQAAVVGSEVIAFVKGVTPEQRSDVVNAALLAQLVAKKKCPEPTSLPEVLAWYDQYFDVLSQVGFVIQDKGFAEYVETSDTFEAHEAIFEVAATLLAGSPAALAVVKKTLEALQKMSSDSPWITLFHRESQSARTARVQMSLVDRDENAPFLVSTIAFGLQASAKVTQVLFFKFHRNSVTLQHHSGKATIDAEVLASVRDAVAAKLTAFAHDYVAGLDI